MNSRLAQRIVWGVLAAGLLLIGGLSLASWLKPSYKLEDYGALPSWQLLDQNGRTVSLADYKSRIWVADLIFTHCSSICPMLTEKMFALQSSLHDKPEIRLVSFSVDPKNDRPDTLAQYAKAHHAEARWSFLTGTAPQIYTIVKSGFHLPLDSAGGDQTTPIIHSPRFVLVDGAGHVRGYYNGSLDESRKLILSDIESLQSEQTP